jgi:hypothetical protein
MLLNIGSPKNTNLNSIVYKKYKYIESLFRYETMYP